MRSNPPGSVQIPQVATTGINAHLGCEKAYHLRSGYLPGSEKATFVLETLE
jgi:hypothetical protein